MNNIDPTSQIDQLQKEIICTILPLDYILKKLRKDEPQLFNSKELKWSEEQQANFIEFLLLGLPSPPMWIMIDDYDQDSKCKVIDGIQRVLTLNRFIENQLILKGLSKLNKLNEFRFYNLLLSRRKSFMKTSIRLVYYVNENPENIEDLRKRINS